jgi:hypothetical protein
VTGESSLPRASAPESTEPGHVFYAIADASFFIGTVALVNSLRLTGNGGPVVVLDTGLRPEQRSFLERECRVAPVELDPGLLTVFVKPYVGALERTRTVILIDTDVIVTASLAGLVAEAQTGKICAFREAAPDDDRHFPEWEQLFGLRARPRQQPYASGSFLALSMERWHWLTQRWWEICQAVQEERSKRPFLLRREDVLVDPVGFNEQDVLNALLRSEVPDEDVLLVEHQLAPSWHDRRRVDVLDAASLRCAVDGLETLYLHCTGVVKPWQRWGWSRDSFDAFVKLLPRVLVADDVPLRLAPGDVPAWLRGGVSGRAAWATLNGAASSGYRVLGIVPEGLRSRITHRLRTRLSAGKP